MLRYDPNRRAIRQMSWVNDLASSAGIPAGAATLAVAMYAACGAAEKVARPEALKDIGRILNDPSWERSVQPSAIIERVFVWTFGERHFSWKCVSRSMIATLVILIVLASIMYSGMAGRYLVYFENELRFGREVTNVQSNVIHAELSLVGYAFGTLISDYLSLLKTRWILGRFELSSLPQIFRLCVADAGISIIISLAVLVVILIAINSMLGVLVFGGPDFIEDMIGHSFRMLRGEGQWFFVAKWDAENHVITDYPLANIICCFTTLFTSIWTLLITLASIIIKLLAPLQRFTAWFFDVDKHPVKAIGIVAGALVMIGSLIWSLVRALI
jgi:hypothetical protein